MGEIDKKAFRAPSYGLYIVTSLRDGKPVGCVVNTVVQVTSSPAQISVAVNKENYTAFGIRETGAFEAVVLSENVSMEHIGLFGFQSSATVDKFGPTDCKVDSRGISWPTEAVVSRFQAKVVNEIDLGTHLLFIGEVEEAEVCSSDAPMTYAYYHKVKGGKTPPKASSFSSDVVAEEAPAAEPAEEAKPKYGWKCQICGFVVEQDELPDDFKCPMCGMGKEYFERVEL